MELTWVREEGPTWDASKERLLGGARAPAFGTRFRGLSRGAPVPGEWWHVERGGEVVGYGFMDVVWGDAEILLATAPGHEGQGVGAFVLDHLRAEARVRGLNYVYNAVPPHAEAAQVSRWLQKRGFRPSEDGKLLRASTR